MKSVLWPEPARSDLAAVDTYWWPLDPVWAETLLGRIEQAGEYLRGLPEGGSPVDQREMRKWRVARTPYILLYRVRRDTIEILRVQHDRQNWQPE